MPSKNNLNTPIPKLRIIAGKWRSRVITFQPADGLRPTGDRIRETLFNWLSTTIDGARCIDVFAGSGALSFEALSRGASQCTSLEQQGAAIKNLYKNASALRAENLNIVQADSIHFLQHSPPDQPFHIAFVDPPFSARLLTQTCELLNSGGWLSHNARIYCEMEAADSSFIAPDNWEMLREKVSGDVRYCLYSRVEPKS